MPTVYVRNSGSTTGIEPTFGNPLGIGLRTVSHGEVLRGEGGQYYAAGEGFISSTRVVAITRERALLLTQEQYPVESVVGIVSALPSIEIEVPPLWNKDP